MFSVDTINFMGLAVCQLHGMHKKLKTIPHVSSKDLNWTTEPLIVLKTVDWRIFGKVEIVFLLISCIVIAHVKFKLFSAFNPTFSFSYLDLFICLCQWSQFFFVTCKQVLFKIITISDCLPSHYFQILIPCVLLFVWRRMGLTKHCWWNYVAESRPVQRFHKTGCRTAPNPNETVNPSLTHRSVPDRSRTRDLLGTSAGVRVETWNPLKLDLLGKRGRRSGGGAYAARRRRSRPRGQGRASSRGSVGAMGCCCLDGWMLQHGPGLTAGSTGTRRRWVDLCSQFVCTEQGYLLSLLCCSFPSICSFGFVNCCSFKP